MFREEVKAGAGLSPRRLIPLGDAEPNRISVPAGLGHVQRRNASVRYGEIIKQNVPIPTDLSTIVIRGANRHNARVDDSQIVEENEPVVARIADLNQIMNHKGLHAGPAAVVTDGEPCSMGQRGRRLQDLEDGVPALAGKRERPGEVRAERTVVQQLLYFDVTSTRLRHAARGRQPHDVALRAPQARVVDRFGGYEVSVSRLLLTLVRVSVRTLVSLR